MSETLICDTLDRGAVAAEHAMMSNAYLEAEDSKLSGAKLLNNWLQKCSCGLQSQV